MSIPIAPVSGSAAASSPQAAERKEKLHHAAAEFESLLVKQLLTAAKIAGDGKASGYSEMGVDALAQGVEKAGGLGLARRLEEALSPAALHPHIGPHGSR